MNLSFGSHILHSNALQFGASDKEILKAKKIRDKDILKAKKKKDKADKKAAKEKEKADKQAFEDSYEGQKQRVAKKARNKFLAKSYGKFNLPVVGTAVGLSFINPLFLLLIPSANIIRACGEGIAYADADDFGTHGSALNTFSRARKIRKKTEDEFDELKKLADEQNENNGKIDKEAIEADPKFNLSEGEY